MAVPLGGAPHFSPGNAPRFRSFSGQNLQFDKAGSLSGFFVKKTIVMVDTTFSGIDNGGNFEGSARCSSLLFSAAASQSVVDNEKLPQNRVIFPMKLKNAFVVARVPSLEGMRMASSRCWLGSIFSFFAIFALSSSASGQLLIYTGTNPGSNSWAEDTNWLNGIVANGQTNIASFSGIDAQHFTVNLSTDPITALPLTNWNLGRLDFSNIYGSNIIPPTTSLSIVFGTNLTFNLHGIGGDLINSTATSKPLMISGGNIRLHNSGNILAAGNVTINSAFSQNSAGLGINKTGAGTLTLNGALNYSGDTQVSAGTLIATLANSQTRIITTGGVYQLNNSQTIGHLSGGIGNVNLQANTLSINDNGSATHGGAINGTGGINKNGAGTLVFTGTKAYSGNTNVNSGVLQVDGVLSLSNVNVASGATLQGTGSLGGDVLIEGIFNPGNSIGTIETGSLTFGDGSEFVYEMDTTNLLSDLVVVDGDLNIGSGVALNLQLLNDVEVGGQTSFSLISYAGGWNGGEFDGMGDGSIHTFGQNDFWIRYNVNNGGSNQVMLIAVPEPSTLFVLGLLGATGCILRRRRVKR